MTPFDLTLLVVVIIGAIGASITYWHTHSRNGSSVPLKPRRS